MTEADPVRESMKSATDADLIHLAAKRLVENSTISQVDSASVEQGMVQGMEFILRQTLPEEESASPIEDPVLAAARDEIRDRVVERFTPPVKFTEKTFGYWQPREVVQ